MDFIIIAIAALLASMLTFFSGFGLGTILTGVFVIFFPVDTAIALTAIVHVLNNLFKAGLIGRHMNTGVVMRFGVPAIIGAVGGSLLLISLMSLEPLVQYAIGDRVFHITPIKLIIGLLMLAFSMFELVPRFQRIQFPQRTMYAGGLLSGFFGGLSGHQGALRSAFLVKVGLSKEAFIATGLVIAVLIDLTRLPVYMSRLTAVSYTDNMSVLIVAVLAAFIGAYIGNRLLRKVTLRFVQTLVGVMIGIIALLLIGGIL